MRYFTFNGASSLGVFLTNSIQRQLLAPIEASILEIRGKSGGIAQKSKLKIREIEIEVTLIRHSDEDLRSFIESVVVPWLFTEDDKQLIISDEPNRYYNAKLVGDTDLDELLATGSTTLTFLCADPFKYNVNEQSILFTAPSTSQSTTFVNNGTALTYPRFRIVPTGSITYVKFTNTTTGKILLLHNYDGVLNAWKVIIADTNLNRIYDDSTGERKDYILDLASDYFPLAKGNNVITMETNYEPQTSSPISARLIYTERYY